MSVAAAPAGHRVPGAGGRGARVALESVRVEYATRLGRLAALDGVSLTVGAGWNVAVVGPSGSGKSTLLAVLGGLEQPSAGAVRVGDATLSAMSERARATMRRRDIGFVFQSDNLAPFLTVAENVGLASVLAGDPDVALQRQELLEELGIGSLAHRYPDQLSGGQRQRVAVARALVRRPRLVLADEPTGALDAAGACRVIDLLLRLHCSQGSTLVVVTHDRTVAERMDAVIEMGAGRVTGTTVQYSGRRS